MLNVQEFPILQIEEYLFKGRRVIRDKTDTIYASFEVIENPKDVVIPAFVQFWLQAYISKSLGFDISETEDHWALHLNLSKVRIIRDLKNNIRFGRVNLNKHNIAAAQKRFNAAQSVSNLPTFDLI